MAEPIMTVSGLSKSFGTIRVLRDVSFQIGAGDVIGIIGPSGSGKSTLLRCLNLLEQADSGRIYLDGQLVSEPGARGGLWSGIERRALKHRVQVGMVFQNFNLFPHMSALQNIMEAPITVLRQPRKQAEQTARALLAKVRLSDRADHYPHQLSGGQQQRVAIARALAMSPRVMLFDEVTSALDPELVGEVLQTVKDLAREGMTMVLVSHEMDFIREVASQILFMHDGRILEASSPAEFFRAPVTEPARRFLSRMHGAQRG